MELALPTLEEFLKTPIGRKVPPLTRLIASKVESGDVPEVIARALAISTDLVNQQIKIIQRFPCRSGHEKMVEEEQQEEDRERAAAASDRMALHTVGIPKGLQAELDRSLKQKKAEALRRENEVQAAVRSGNMHAFNKAMPTTPTRSDLLGHAVPFSHIVKIVETRGKQKASKGSDDESVHSSEIVDKIASTNSADVADQFWISLGHDRSGRDVMDRLLRTAKAAVLSAKLRRVAKLWAGGMSETDIAARVGTSQPTVSRMILEAKRAMDIAL